jgi:serine/threonine protein kinase
MGSVEAAAEPVGDGTTRIVALKRILRAGANDAPRVEMFLREARLTTLLEHPNVIRSLAYGETDGELFLAMEYVAGEPLSHVLAAAAEGADRERCLPLAVIAHILAESCEGLHAAHELRGPDGEPLGVVHRDISPQNVMVGYDGSVKLLDFGVAKIDLLDCVARTKTGEVKGKTAYMSPEQAMGDAIDRRSDLYSMGAVLFECVTGRRMWGAGTDLDVLRKLALEEPPRLLDVAPDAPPELAALVARLVERDRTKRPETARELAIALRAFAGTAGLEAGVDAAALRGTMSRLFPGEAERREAAIAGAIASGKRAESSLSSVDAARGPGESGPVFVTHHGPVTPQGRSHPGRVASIAAVAAATLLSAALGFTLFHRAPTAAHETHASTSPSSESTPAAPLAPAPASSTRPSQTAVAAADPTSTPAADTERTPPIAVQTHRPPTVLRRGLVPRHVVLAQPQPAQSGPASQSSTAGVAATPSSPSAPPAPAPAPPDVDPTPF